MILCVNDVWLMIKSHLTCDMMKPQEISLSVTDQNPPLKDVMCVHVQVFICSTQGWNLHELNKHSILKHMLVDHHKVDMISVAIKVRVSQVW